MAVEFMLEILGCFHVYLAAAIELNIEETLSKKNWRILWFSSLVTNIYSLRVLLFCK